MSYSREQIETAVKAKGYKWFEDTSNKNVIYSFNYGFKDYKVINKNNKFYYNNIICEIKSIFKYDNTNNLIFYLNIFINGKLNINIISPFIL